MQDTFVASNQSVHHDVRPTAAGQRGITVSVSSLTRASYTAQLISWTAQDLPDLDNPLNHIFRRLSGDMSPFPIHLLYLPSSLGSRSPASLHLP